MAERIVTQVKPKRKLLYFPELILQKRVAAYARVSSDSDEQLNSVEAQKDYFEKLIKERPDWVFVGVYADEGISGTTLNKRVAFNKMIEDAMNGKIDLIVTKSLSRFARNTVDALNIIRKLKSVQVGVYFEKEDINTLDAKGEFLITLMSSLAEEESRSMSENIKWGQRKRFAEGKYSLPYARFLGYKKGADGCPELVEDEAKIIRIIFRLFLEGHSTTSIAKKLTNANILSPGKQTHWQRQTIKSILRNEKYYGAALLQKSYSADYRGRIMKRNHGELPMYYIENDHEGIVTKEIYNAVQERLNREHRLPVTTTIFAGKLYCSDCDGLYTCLPFHSTTYNDLVWKCSNRHWYKSSCSTPHLYEEMLKPIFHEIMVTTLKKDSSIIRECVSALKYAKNDECKISRKTIIDAVTNYDINSEAEQQLWRMLIQKVVVHPGHLLEFHIIDRSRIEYRMVKTSPRMPKPTKCAEEDIRNDSANGYQVDFLAKKYEFSTGTINRILKQNNKESIKDIVIKEYKQGKKQAVIARELDIPFGTVRSIIFRAHLTNAPAKNKY